MFEVLVDDEVVATVDDVEQAKALICQHKEQRKEARVRMRKTAQTMTEVEKAQQRERDNFASGRRRALPDWLPVKAEHFAHWPRLTEHCDGSSLAFFPSEERLVAELPMRSRVSTYLAQHMGLPSHVISTLSQRMIAEAQGLVFEIVSDKGTIRKYYTSHNMHNESSRSLSCMHYEFSNLGDHPSAVYGDGSDLHLATVANRDGVPVGRALVHVEDKYFVRLYGKDEAVQQALRSWLEVNGYERRASYDGAKIKKIREDDDEYLMPYIDGEANTVSEHDATHWVICFDGDYDATSTGGTISMSESRDDVECENCGEHVDESDTRSVVTRVTGSGTTRYNATWCFHCWDNNTFHCEYIDSAVSDDIGAQDVRVRRRPSGSYVIEVWNDNAADAHAFFCERTTERYANNMFTPIEVCISGGHETWCQEATVDERFYCEGSAEWYSNDDYTAVPVDNEDSRETWCLEANEDDLEEDEYRPGIYLLKPTEGVQPTTEAADTGVRVSESAKEMLYNGPTLSFSYGL
jgi:hypothetical protein